MCEDCRNKAEEIAELARYFRDKAKETAIEYYAVTMSETARMLEQLSRHFAERCRCHEDEEARDRLFPPFMAHYVNKTPADLYWRARREIRNDRSAGRMPAIGETLPRA